MLCKFRSAFKTSKSNRPVGTADRKRRLMLQQMETRQLLAADGWLFTGGDDQFQSVDMAAVDDSGSVYMAVGNRGTIDFAPDESFPDNRDIVTAANGEKQNIVAKFNADGSFAWATPTSPGILRVESFEVNSDGVYWEGIFNGSVDLDLDDPSASHVVDSGSQSNASFFAKLDGETGDHDWVHVVGNQSDVGERSLATAKDGTAYLIMNSSGGDDVLFDGVTYPNDFTEMAILAEVGLDGTVNRTQRIGSFQDLSINNITVNDAASDPSEWSVVGVGTSISTVYFGDSNDVNDESTAGQSNSNYQYTPGRDDHTLTFALDTLGDLNWANVYEAEGVQKPFFVQVSDDGDVFVDARVMPEGLSGDLPGVTTFDASRPDGSITGAGDFLLRLNPDGSFGNVLHQTDWLQAYTMYDAGPDGLVLGLTPDGENTFGGYLLETTDSVSEYLFEVHDDFTPVRPLLTAGPLFSYSAVEVTGDVMTAAGQARGTGIFPDGTPYNTPINQQFNTPSWLVFASSNDLPIPPDVPTVPTPPTTSVLFEDSFEIGSNSNDWNSKWVEDRQNDWFRSTQRSTDGSRSAEVDGYAGNASLTMASGVDLSGQESATLSFDWYIERSVDSGEYLAVDIWNGASWTEVARLRGNSDAENTWHSESIDVDEAMLTPDFKARFRGKMSVSNEDANVDNVKLVGSVAAPPASNELPVADAGRSYTVAEGGNVTLDASGSLDTDGTIVAYEWDFDGDGFDDATGSTANLPVNSSGSLEVRVRVTDDRGGMSIDNATVTVNNVAPTAYVGGPIATEVGQTFTLDASGSSDPGNDIVSYEWDTNGDGNFNAVGESIQWSYADAGIYSVGLRVTDADGAGNTVFVNVTVNDTPPATLDETALVAHWTFDGNTSDSAPFGSSSDDGSLRGNAATLTDSNRGDVLSLDGDGDYFDVADSVDLNKTIVSQRTIGLWFKTDDVDSRQVLFEEGGTSRGLSIYVDDGEVYVGGWNKPGGQSGWAGTFLSAPIVAGQWHHVTMSLDGGTSMTSDAMRGYLDGELFGSGAGSQVWNHSGDVGIGAMDDATVFHDGNSGGDGHGLSGKIDDVRIYDRVLGANEVDQLWSLF